MDFPAATGRLVSLPLNPGFLTRGCISTSTTVTELNERAWAGAPGIAQRDGLVLVRNHGPDKGGSAHGRAGDPRTQFFAAISITSPQRAKGQ